MRKLLVVPVLVTAASTACGTAAEPPDGAAKRAVAQATTAETTPAEETETVSGYGLKLTVPAAWEARAYLAQEVTPILQAANFPLPPPVDDLPTDPPVGSFGAGGIYIALFDVGDVSHGGVPMPSPFPWTDATLPLAIEEAHFGTPEGLKPPPSGLSLARRYLVIGERAYVLRVASAAEMPTVALVAEANRVLSTLSLSGWLPTKCPPNWPGPWTACPEADWVRRVAERAGYRVVSETGSALVAEGKGHSFYIWATELEGPIGSLAAREGWRPLARIAGAPLYGDESLWRWWPAQDSMFWMQAGPREDSSLPTVRQMDELIRASQTLPPPG